MKNLKKLNSQKYSCQWVIKFLCGFSIPRTDYNSRGKFFPWNLQIPPRTIHRGSTNVGPLSICQDKIWGILRMFKIFQFFEVEDIKNLLKPFYRLYCQRTKSKSLDFSQLFFLEKINLKNGNFRKKIKNVKICSSILLKLWRLVACVTKHLYTKFCTIPK